MRRVPGKYVVWVFGAIIVALFVAASILAFNLTPAADRFHNRSVPTNHK